MNTFRIIEKENKSPKHKISTTSKHKISTECLWKKSANRINSFFADIVQEKN